MDCGWDVKGRISPLLLGFLLVRIFIITIENPPGHTPNNIPWERTLIPIFNQVKVQKKKIKISLIIDLSTEEDHGSIQKDAYSAKLQSRKFLESNIYQIF